MWSYGCVVKEKNMVEKKTETSVSTSLTGVFELVTTIEQRFPVDSIKLSDGTKIWNLIRVLLCFYPWKRDAGTKTKKSSLKTFVYMVKDGVLPFNLPSNKIDICGFSDTESRKLREGMFYDVYIDPLYEVLGDEFWVFEWPTAEGKRRAPKKKIYSKNYVPMHIPVFSKTFFDIGVYHILKRKKVSKESEDVLQDAIVFFCNHTGINEDELSNHIYDAVTIFFYMKQFFVRFLRKISPKAVLMRCGYGRFHMAMAQACKELGIPSIELQHGNITKYHIGYVKASLSENKDCIPEYLLTCGDVFSDIVRKGNLFHSDKVISIGFPYMDEVKESTLEVNHQAKNFISKFSTTILVTSQWTVADEIKNFIVDVSKELEKTGRSIGIIFKPHPRDEKDYSDMETYQNIFLADKYGDLYELLQVIDIHSTVYSTSAIESLAFGKPNMFLDIGINIQDLFDIIDEKSSFLLKSPKQFIERLDYVVSHYGSVSKAAYKASEKFYKGQAKKNFEKFLSSINIRTGDKR
jgi:hypothetical protein